MKLYYEDPYQQEFEARVTACEPKGSHFLVQLDQTAFYPEGGGQPYDTGILGEARVLEVHEKNGMIIHKIDAPLVPGSKVSGAIDWERRFSIMQNHTGEHILSGIIHSRFGFDNVGFHMGSDAITIDMNGTFTEEELLWAEAEANQRIYDNLPVKVEFPEKDVLDRMEYRSKKELAGAVRIVTVPQADCCACCGIHVARTGEIGILKIIGAIHYKGGTRISLLCGRRALDDYRQKHDSVLTISTLLSSKAGEVAAAAKRMKEESAFKDLKIGSLYKQLFAYKAETYPAGTRTILLQEENLEPLQLRHFAMALLLKAELVMICSGDAKAGWKYVMAARNINLRELAGDLNRTLNGRGGGSPEMIQGTVYTSWPAIEAYVSTLAPET